MLSPIKEGRRVGCGAEIGRRVAQGKRGRGAHWSGEARGERGSIALISPFYPSIRNQTRHPLVKLSRPAQLLALLETAPRPNALPSITFTLAMTKTDGECLCGGVKVGRRGFNDSEHLQLECPPTTATAVRLCKVTSPFDIVNAQVVVDGSLEDFESLTCHCNSCKRRSGGIASYAFMVPKEKVTVKDPDSLHVEYIETNTTSGKPMVRTMCKRCGSPVIVIEDSAKDIRCLQYGLFAVGDSKVELPQPQLELFRKQACQWERILGEKVLDEQ